MPPQIFVRISGKTLACDVDPEKDTPKTLLNIVSARLNIPDHLLFISFQGKPLHDMISLSTYGIKPYSTVEGSIRAAANFSKSFCSVHVIISDETQEGLSTFKSAIQSHHMCCVVNLFAQFQKSISIEVIIQQAVQDEELLCVELLVLGTKHVASGLNVSLQKELARKQEMTHKINLADQTFDTDGQISQTAQNSIAVHIENLKLALALGLACKNNKLKVIQHLLRLPGCQDAIDKYITPRGNTMLHIAAFHDSSLVLHYLLTQNAKPDVWNLEALTPFQLAFKRGHVLCTYLLLSFGAKPETEGLGKAFRDTPQNPLQYIPTLKTDMRSLLASGSFSDITFIVEQKRVKCHKCILSARSEYFKLLFTNNMRESAQTSIELADIEYDTFLAILHFLYSEELPTTLSVSQILQVLLASDMYLLDQLKDFCTVVLCESLQNTPQEIIGFSHELLAANKFFLVDRFPNLLVGLQSVLRSVWVKMLERQILRDLHPDFVPMVFKGSEFAKIQMKQFDCMMIQ